MTWEAAPTGKRGRQPDYSDAAIQTCLTMKVLCGMALRQTTGFVESGVNPLDWTTGFTQHRGLIGAGLDVVLVETRQVKGALKAMPIKTDRRDAGGIARLLHLERDDSTRNHILRFGCSFRIPGG